MNNHERRSTCRRRSWKRWHFPATTSSRPAEGKIGEPLQTWEVAPGAGCRRRPGWRDRPTVGASHFFLAPATEVSPLRLLEDLSSGYYLVGCDEGVVMRGGRLSLRVYGFEVASGRPIAPVLARMTWDPRTTLRDIVAVGRDLRFSPMGAMIGSPTLMVTGWDLC